MRPAVLVVGGSGYFGRLLVAELLRFTGCDVIVGGRNVHRLAAVCDSFGPTLSQRLSWHVVDLGKPETLEAALGRAQIAICAAGPFQDLPATMARLCIERGVHYIDLADDRKFVMSVRALVSRHKDPGALPAVCSGWSAVPALSGMLAYEATKDMDRAQSIDIQIAPGNRHPRSVGTVSSLLSSVGRPFKVRRNGKWQPVRGWSDPRRFAFPQPIGSRIGYLVDAPDLEIFPDLFGVERVEFRVGSELGLLNQTMSVCSWLRTIGVVREWARWSTCLQKGSALLGFLGHDHGAVGVEARGMRYGRVITKRVCVVARRGGERIPVMPAVIVARALLAEKPTARGLVPVSRWITFEQLRRECESRGYQLIVQECDGRNV